MRLAQRWSPHEHRSLPWDGQRLRKPKRPRQGSPPLPPGLKTIVLLPSCRSQFYLHPEEAKAKDAPNP